MFVLVLAPLSGVSSTEPAVTGVPFSLTVPESWLTGASPAHPARPTSAAAKRRRPTRAVMRCPVRSAVISILPKADEPDAERSGEEGPPLPHPARGGEVTGGADVANPGPVCADGPCLVPGL